MAGDLVTDIFGIRCFSAAMLLGAAYIAKVRTAQSLGPQWTQAGSYLPGEATFRPIQRLHSVAAASQPVMVWQWWHLLAGCSGCLLRPDMAAVAQSWQ